MLNAVTSLAVPAVVGMAIRGFPGAFTVFMPSYWFMGDGLVRRMLMAFAESMELPPPTATMRSTLAERAMAAASSTWVSGGLGSTPSYSTASTPAAFRDEIRPSTMPAALTPLS